MLTHALTASLSLSPLLLQGDLIWYDAGGTGEFDLPIGARVKQADSGQIIIVTDDDEVRTAVFAAHKHTHTHTNTHTNKQTNTQTNTNTPSVSLTCLLPSHFGDHAWANRRSGYLLQKQTKN